MKLSIRILLCAMAALMILALPFAVPSGSMLEEYQDTWADEAWNSGLIRWLVPTANAEEAQEETSYALPIDFSAGMQPNPDAYTEDGYQDDSLTIRMETREEDGVIWRIGYVQIKDASQLRTGIAGSKATSNRSTYISAMAKEYHAGLSTAITLPIRKPKRPTKSAWAKPARQKPTRKRISSLLMKTATSTCLSSPIRRIWTLLRARG